jgi:UDP-2,3-diacylglucosamine hydrolase
MLHQVKSSNSAKQFPKNLALFISDLHLCEARPHITDAFIIFLDRIATKSNALYILGDLFEYWAGDDDIDDSFHRRIIQAFKQLSCKQTDIYLMHGNRDFLIDEVFCEASGITLLQDPTLITINDQRILLSHGDALCVDDIDYQTIRTQFRNPKWQEQFLSHPLTVRKQQIEQIRAQSEAEKAKKAMMIMDVNDDAVANLLRDYQYPPIFIHGHTHRPAKHDLILDNHPITRWVLGDWYEQGSFLALDKEGFQSFVL